MGKSINMKIYLLMINLFTFFLFYLDKRKAIKNKYRISENTLLFFSLVGGSLGGFLAMEILRHKNLKLKFRILLRVFLLIDFLFFFLLYRIILWWTANNKELKLK